MTNQANPSFHVLKNNLFSYLVTNDAWHTYTTQSQPYLQCEETSHTSGPEQGQSLILVLPGTLNLQNIPYKGKILFV